MPEDSRKEVFMTTTITNDMIYEKLTKHDDDLEEIKIQTKKTNGRVNALEDCVNNLKKTNIVYWFKDRKYLIAIITTLSILLFSDNIFETIKGIVEFFK